MTVPQTTLVSLPVGDHVLADWLESRGHLDAAMRVRDVDPPKNREILYSPGFGAGWTSWANGPKEMIEFMLTYQPIISFLKAGGKSRDLGDENHPLLVAFVEECMARGWKPPYLGGAKKLQVAQVAGPVRIFDFDGSESYEEPDGDWL